MTDRKIFREKLYNHTLPVNEGLWSAIEAQLPPEQTQKRFPVFWMTLFSTALLGGAIMIGLFNQTSDAAPAPIPGPTPPPSHNEVIASASNTLNESSTVDVTGTSAISTEEIRTEKSNAASATSSLAGNTAKANRSANTNQSKTNKNSNTKSTSNKNQNATANANSNANANANTNNTTNSAVNSSEALVNAKAANQNFTLLPYRNTSQTAFLSIAEQNFAPSSLTLMPGIAPDPNCYKFGDIGPHYALSVDGMFGIGFSPKSFEENGGETADYISARKATESYSYAWSLGARLNLHHRSGLTGRLGLQYTQVGDIFDYTDSLATQTTTRIDSFFAADGTFLYTEVNQVLIDGTLVKKIHNTYKYLDIPLLIGYEMRLGRNIIMLNAGPVFNLTSTHEGQILDSMLHPRSITPGTPGAIDVYKTNVGMSIYLGAGILFPISDRLSALVEPSYIYRLKPVSLNSYELRENRHYVSLNLGVRYHIN